MRGSFTILCLAIWLITLSNQSFSATEAQKRFRENITTFASMLSEKTTDQSIANEIKSFIMIQLTDEWNEMRRRKFKRQEAFNGETLLEELVDVSKTLSLEEQQKLKTMITSDLLSLIGTRPGGGGTEENDKSQQKQPKCDTFWDMFKAECWEWYPGPSENPKKTNDNNAASRWEGAKDLIDQL